MKTMQILITGIFFAIIQIATYGQIAPLSQDEESDILSMLEEEKLARDVYLALGEKWDVQVFRNITESEKQHYRRMREMAERHDLKIPRTVATDKTGKFKNKDLQLLYDQLMEAGNQSLVEALKVGARIEETDIKDLDQALAHSDRAELTTLYSSLQKASENHLRAFTKNLDKRGITYAPMVLSSERYDRILSSEHSKGNCCQEGDKAACKGKGATKGKCCTDNKANNKRGKGRGGSR